MSDSDATNESDAGDLGPMPEATSEEPQLEPGGADAVEVDAPEERADSEPRDLDPDRNPGVDDAMPDDISQREDKEQAPAEGDDDEAGGSVTGDADGQPEDGAEASGSKKADGESGGASQD